MNETQPNVSSRLVARYFGKRHDHVLRDIRHIAKRHSGLSSAYRDENFQISFYISAQNKKQPCYMLTPEGLTMLVMGYTGDRSRYLKEIYAAVHIESKQIGLSKSGKSCS